MPRKPLGEAEDDDVEPRVRKLEVEQATMALQVASLFDNHGSPGILSEIRNTLSKKIDDYFQTVTKFIEGEPSRKNHIENNARQAVADAKVIAKVALDEAEDRQNRMHQENRRTSEKTEIEVTKLREDFSRHEKFVQRGIGSVVVGQAFIVVAGFAMTAVAFLGGAIWWVFTHVSMK
jgi:hypothetical protein